MPLITIITACIVARLAMPYIVKQYVNKTLAALDGYRGEIDDIDINLYRGAYQIKTLRINKTGPRTSLPFVNIPEVDLSIAWRHLLKGHLVSDIVVNRPEINFVDSEDDRKDQAGKSANWVNTLKALFPVTISSLTVRDGKISFKNPSASPKIDISIENIEVDARNFTNVAQKSEGLFARVTSSGKITPQANIEVKLDIDPLAQKPTFNLDAKIGNLDLKNYNDFLRHYLSIDVKKGLAVIVCEIAAKDGSIEGYVKPLFRELNILSASDLKENEGFLALAWEAVVASVAEILENQPHDQLAMKVPIKGKISSLDTDGIAIVASILKNAFISAFKPIYDNTISLKKENH